MTKRLYMITAPSIKETGRISFKFMFDSQAPFNDFADIAENYGMIKLTDKESDEVNPFKLARGEPNAIGPDGVKKWRVYVGNSKGLVLSGSVEESPNEEGLQRLLTDMDDCVLLMEEKLLDRFCIACSGIEIQLTVFQYHSELSTS